MKSEGLFGTGVAADPLAPRFRITRVYMVTGLAFLGPAWLCLVRAAGAAAAGRWSDPYLLSAVHLFAVGFLLTVAHGAMLQIAPVAFQGRLYSIGLGYVEYVLMILGTAAFPAGFLSGRWTLVAAGGCLVLSSFLILLWNLGKTARTMKKRAEALSIAPVFLFLLAAVFLGIRMAVGRPAAGPATLSLHVLSGLAGWFTTLILVLSPRLMSVFVSSRYSGLRRGRSAALLYIGAAAAGLGTALDRAPGAQAAVWAGWLLYAFGYGWVLWDLFLHFRHRRRREVERVIRWIHGGLYAGFPMLGALVFAVEFTGERWALAGLLLFAFGFLQWIVAAYAAKILPFLRWMARYGHGSVRRGPGVREMLPEGLAAAALVAFAAGGLLTALGTGFGEARLTGTGASAGLAGWALYVWTMVRVYRK